MWSSYWGQLYISHMALLEKYRDRANQLPGYLLSARTYQQSKHRIFVLLQQGTDYYPLMFNLSSRKFESRSDLDILDTIVCAENEPTAMVNPADIERIVNKVVQIWCGQKSIKIDEVRKICCLHLVPVSEAETIASILRDLPVDDERENL